MNEELFEDTLRKYLRRKPFYPFLVELLDGTIITIEQPTIAMAGGAATYLTERDLIEFACEQVREIRLAPIEMAS
jgi:hypothetical protein